MQCGEVRGKRLKNPLIQVQGRNGDDADVDVRVLAPAALDGRSAVSLKVCA